MPLYPPAASATATRYSSNPADRGWLGWTNDPELTASSSAVPTAGKLYVCRARVPLGGSITSVVYQVNTLGSTLTSGQCFIGIGTTAGLLIGTSADQSAIWAAPGTTGDKNTALVSGPFSVAGPEVEIWILFNGTTGPTFPRGNGNAIINQDFAAPKYSSVGTGLTALPADRTVSGALVASSISWSFAVK